MSFLIICFLAICVGGIMLILPLILSIFLEEKSKKSSLECGFLSIGKNFKSFSVQFYFLLFLFVVFDLEILFLFPFIISYFNWFSFFLTFCFILGVFLVEWYMNSLTWLV